MPITRREWLADAGAGAAALMTSRYVSGADAPARPPGQPDEFAYRYRIAFGAWINDMRRQPLPLEDWPDPQFDEEAIDSAIQAMDLQAAAGFNYLDAWGLFATYGWPPDITSAVDEARRRRLHRLQDAARQRGIGLSLGLGTYSWGYDRIIAADPSVRGRNADGTPHAHAMCDANPKAFDYVTRIIDFTLGQLDFGAVHLESCDLGCCHCPRCAGKDGVVAYNVRINRKTADYIKGNWPDKAVYVITINWVPAGKQFGDAELAQVVELSKHVNCVFDQGHTGYQVPESRRRAFISRLHCAYGTSGRLWLYPETRWDRASYFLPYPSRAGEALVRKFADGVRGCLYYQGPVTNAGQELMMAVGGRILSDTRRAPEAVLAEVLERLYRPRDADAARRLERIVRLAEESYFGQWSEERFRAIWHVGVPGELKLDQGLWGTSPGPATYLREPCLDAAGRKEYRRSLREILAELPKLEGRCDDGGRLANIRRSVIVTLNLLNTICSCLGEPLS
jgi:hypothetical protein